MSSDLVDQSRAARSSCYLQTHLRAASIAALLAPYNKQELYFFVTNRNIFLRNIKVQSTTDIFHSSQVLRYRKNEQKIDMENHIINRNAFYVGKQNNSCNVYIYVSYKIVQNNQKSINQYELYLTTGSIDCTMYRKKHSLFLALLLEMLTDMNENFRQYS